MITKEFLSQCGDEQINKGVAWLLTAKKCQKWAYNSDSEFHYHWGRAMINCPSDYCSQIIHAWPIIEWIFNQDVTFAMNGGGIMTGNLGSKYGGIKLDIAAKPLRAAMEVYILMSVNK